MSTKTKNILFSIIICILAVGLIVLVFEFVKIGNLKSQQAKLNSNLTNLENQINNYAYENSYYNDREAYLEEYAREVLNWGKDGRTTYN